MGWPEVGVMVGVLSPLVGVPLVMITLYLRAIREHQTSTTSEITSRIHTIEASLRHLLQRTGELDREYATKEEWVRESMLTRQRLERLTELVTRIETELDNGHGLVAEVGRATGAMVELVKAMSVAGRGGAAVETCGERN